MEDFSREDVTGKIDRMVEQLLDDAEVPHPPIDAIALAQRHLAMSVELDRSPETREELTQWNAARQIGKHLEPELLRTLGIPPETKRSIGESLPNLFANRLLIPTSWLVEAIRELDYDLLALKERFSTVSHEAIAWRLLDLDSPCIITIVDNDEIYKRRSNAIRVKRVLSAAESACQKFVHDNDEPHEVRKDGWTVQGWPIPDHEWKREILRSVLEEMYD